MGVWGGREQQVLAGDKSGGGEWQSDEGADEGQICAMQHHRMDYDFCINHLCMIKGD